MNGPQRWSRNDFFSAGTRHSPLLSLARGVPYTSSAPAHPRCGDRRAEILLPHRERLFRQKIRQQRIGGAKNWSKVADTTPYKMTAFSHEVASKRPQITQLRFHLLEDFECNRPSSQLSQEFQMSNNLGFTEQFKSGGYII